MTNPLRVVVTGTGAVCGAGMAPCRRKMHVAQDAGAGRGLRLQGHSCPLPFLDALVRVVDLAHAPAVGAMPIETRLTEKLRGTAG